jgi:hypothetical protein
MKRLILPAVLCLAATPLMAHEYEAAMKSFYEGTVAGWAAAPEIIASINAQNETTAGFDQSMIDQLDLAWRAEVGAQSTPTISPVMDNATSEFLAGLVAAAGGQVTEIFVMDAKGLNVAASDVTSDYWQGDEAKFQLTYGVGADAVHLSDIEFDESTQAYQAQISVAVSDPETGDPIGAITVGVNAESLM